MSKKSLSTLFFFFFLFLGRIETCYSYPAFCCYCRDVAAKAATLGLPAPQNGEIDGLPSNSYCMALLDQGEITPEESVTCVLHLLSCPDCGEMVTNPNSDKVKNLRIGAPALTSYY